MCFLDRMAVIPEFPESEISGTHRALRNAIGARDTLRLEAGMNLYGQDMDEAVSPLAAGLGWTVDLASPRDFVYITDLPGLGISRIENLAMLEF